MLLSLLLTLQAQAAPPDLVVFLVVDQYSEHLHDLAKAHYTGGLARLTGEGAWVGTGRYRHACTWTAPGHATLGTGAHPAVHTIGANGWFEGDKLVTAGGPGQLAVPTLGDVASDDGRTVVSLSLKQRGATLIAGYRATTAAWLTREDGRWTWTTRGTAEAGWLPDHDAIAATFDTPWTLLDGTPRRPDLSPWEADAPGIGHTFPHPAAPDASTRGLFATPMAGRVLVDAAIAAVKDPALALGRHRKPDLLSVSFSHVDYVGHTFTPESQESVDTVLRLDRDLADLWATLDAEIGAGRWTVVLTADHGSNATPAAYISGNDLARAVTARFAAKGLPGLAYVHESSLWFWDIDEARRAAYVEEALAVVADDPRFAVAVDVRAPVPAGTLHADAVAACLVPGRSGDVQLWPRWGVYWAFEPTPKLGQPIGAATAAPAGTGHGSPWAYDTDVPLLAWGAGVKSGGDDNVDIRRVSPTLAALLGLKPPAAATEPPVRLR